jgi:hypothetical protein
MSEYADEFDEAPEQGAADAMEPGYVTRDQLDQTNYAVQQMAHWLANNWQPGDPAPSEPQQPPELRLRVNPDSGAWETVGPEPESPPDPAEVAEQLVAERMAPYEPMLNIAQNQMLDSQCSQAFQTIRSQVPDMVFDDTDARFYAEQAAQTGQARTFEDALKMGVARSAQREQQRREAYQAEQQQHLQKLAEARQEPEGGAAAPARETPRGTNAYEEVQKQFFADRRLRTAGS